MNANSTTLICLFISYTNSTLFIQENKVLWIFIGLKRKRTYFLQIKQGILWWGINVIRLANWIIICNTFITVFNNNAINYIFTVSHFIIGCVTNISLYSRWLWLIGIIQTLYVFHNNLKYDIFLQVIFIVSFWTFKLHTQK